MQGFPALCVLLLLAPISLVTGEVFTAIADMEILVDTKFELINRLESYIHEEETRLQRVKQYLEEYQRMYKEASTDVSKYLANPINAFVLVKRLTSDWKEVEDTLVKNSGEALIKNISDANSLLRFPSNQDLKGAAVALVRLQETYNLDTHALSEGVLQGKKYSRHLTAGDCFELGRQSYDRNDYYHTILWMHEALKKYEQEDEKTVARHEMFDYLAYALSKEGDNKMALRMTEEYLKAVPYSKRALINRQYFLNVLRNQSYSEQDDSMDTEDVQSHTLEDVKLKKPAELYEGYNAYKQLCRGEQMMDEGIQSQLRCYYVTNNVPYLLLQPVKAEDAYPNPRIVIYHDVLSDNEIETIKRLAQPRFKRATARNFATGKQDIAEYRISKSSWLRNDEHRYVAGVSRRIEDITGLEMDTAEELQVVNYGIGGHYEPHLDYSTDPVAFESMGTGNRIATWLFYMSDVEAGGATVFPKLNVALWPRKGSAAFWYNLLPSGDGNPRTKHAACPVLTGSKWVSNKWIHEQGQELRRQCRLNREAEY